MRDVCLKVEGPLPGAVTLYDGADARRYRPVDEGSVREEPGPNRRARCVCEELRLSCGHSAWVRRDRRAAVRRCPVCGAPIEGRV